MRDRLAQATPPVVSPPAAKPSAGELLARGNAHLDRGDMWAAGRSYRQAVEVDPRRAEARVNLGYGLRELGRLVEAAIELLCAIGLFPDSADAHYMLGALHLEAGDAVSALPHLERAVALRPALVEAHRDLGKTLFNLGRVAEAEHALKAAVEVAPHNAELRLYLGMIGGSSRLPDFER